ncbi:hypothetical protein Tco_0844438 [Tanacetum coccineum]
MSSDLASSEVTYTSISSHGDPLAWVVDFFRLQEPDSSEAAPASPDYVPGPEELEQALLSPDYVPGPEYPEYFAPSDEEVPIENQPYAVVDSPISLSLGYVVDSNPEEDSEDGPEEEASKEEDEHLALVDSVVALVVDHVPFSEETEPVETDESAEPMPFLSEEEVERLLALPPPPPPSPLISLSSPSAEERLARCLAAPALLSSPLPIIESLSPSTHHPLHPSLPLPPLPSSLHLPPLVPTSLPLLSSPLPPLLASLFIPPLVDRREDTPETELPPRKRLCMTALTSRYKVGKSLTAAPRPAGGHNVETSNLMILRQ